MVPVEHIYRILFALLLVAGPIAAQGANSESEIVRSGGVSLDAVHASPGDKASVLEAPVYRDPFVQPATYAESIPVAEPTTHPETLATTKKMLPLARKQAVQPGTAERPKPASPVQSLTTVGGSLALVLGLFFALAWVTRRGMPPRIAKLPGEVIEVMGKAALSKGQELQLVRIGTKLLLLCVTPHSSETLTEINDPEEVDRLSAVCRRNSPQGVSATFDQMLSSMGREPARGFADDPRTTTPRGGRRYA